MFANKPAPRGQPPNHRSTEAAPNYRQSKADAVPTLGHDVQHDGMAHWLEALNKKYCCRLFQAYIQIKCQK